MIQEIEGVNGLGSSVKTPEKKKALEGNQAEKESAEDKEQPGNFESELNAQKEKKFKHAKYQDLIDVESVFLKSF